MFPVLCRPYKRCQEATVAVNRTLRACQAFVCLCVLVLSGCSGSPSPTPVALPSHTHVYQLKETPKMLSEELAIEKASDAMSQEGFSLDRWHLRKETRAGSLPSKAPDGTPDNYFERFRPTWGRLHFTDGKDNRAVQVSLEGNRLTCEVVRLP